MLSSNETWNIEVYGDYGCPFVHAAALWLRDLKAELGDRLNVTWRFFPLEQINSTNGPDWKVWEQPLDEKNRVQLGFRGALAARKQSQEAFEKFHVAWLESRHAMKAGERPPTVEDVAKASGLDLERFMRDLNDPAIWAEMAADYEKGLTEVGVFGTPTFVFDDGSSAYLKQRPAPPADRAVAVWDEFVDIVRNHPNITEIKRPRKPEAA